MVIFWGKNKLGKKIIEIMNIPKKKKKENVKCLIIISKVKLDLLTSVFY